MADATKPDAKPQSPTPDATTAPVPQAPAPVSHPRGKPAQAPKPDAKPDDAEVNPDADAKAKADNKSDSAFMSLDEARTLRDLPASDAPKKPRDRGEPPKSPQVPGARELEQFRKAKFGDEPGVVRLDTDPREGTTMLVYCDRDGNEVGREEYQPKQAAAAK